MSKKLLSVCSLLVVTGLAGTVLAAAKQWTNANPVYDSWCEPGNWSPSGVPGSSDTAIIDATSPDRGPVIDCTAQALLINGPSPADGNTQVVDVCDSAILTAAPGSEVEGNGWEWRFGAGTAVINITGTASVTIGGRHWRGPDQGRGEIYVTGKPTIVAERDFRGADMASAFFYFDMSSGSMEIRDDFVIGDVGGGQIDMHGGSLIIRDDFDLGGVRGTAPITVNVTGGSIRVGGHFFLPGNESRAGVVVVHLDGGVIDCNQFIHGGADGGQDGPPGMYSGYTDDWLLDISGGQLEIRGDVRDEIDANVAAGQITAYDREGQVKVELIGPNTVVTAIPPDANRALNPRPRDLSENVDPDTLLSWKPGLNATTHHIYLGTNLDDVNNATTSTSDIYKGNQPVDQNSYDPCGPDPLEVLTTYYWRIDEERPGPLVAKGRVWQLTTRAAIVDPNMLLWYRFNEASGNIAADYSGYGNHASISTDGVVPPNWEPNDGQDGGALRFDSDGGPITLVQPPTTVLDQIGGKVSIAVWLKDAYYSGQDNWVFDSGAGGEGGQYHMEAAVATAEEQVLWRAGSDSNDALYWDLEGRNPATLEGWHHWAFIKDETADEMKIYFDGEEAASKSGVLETLDEVHGTPFVIGAPTWTNYGYVGSMDDFRLYDCALSAERVAELVRGGDLGKAWAPTPYDRAQNVVRDVVLEWTAGNYVVTHDLFFGTDFDDVNDADTSTAEIYKGPKSKGDESYEPGPLTLKETYYWRIDEVNNADVNSPWKGNVWTFTVANFLVVDDMENYDDDAAVPENPINETWIDGWWNNTGSTVYLEYGSGATVHNGAKSMWLEYNNNYGGPVENYSEIYANTTTGDKNLGFGRDWTADGMKALTLYFYGDPDNAVEPLYVALEDTGTPGNMYVSNYGDDACEDINDLIEADWRQWDVRLSDFWDGNNVDINDVNKIYIGLGDRDNPVAGGTGVLYIDDIRLYLPRCVPSRDKPVLDLDNNCKVDFGDLRLVGLEWLKSDLDLGTVTAPSAPVLHYAFEDPCGSTITDSSGSYHGTFFIDVNQTPGSIAGRVDPGRSGNSFHFAVPIDHAGIKIPKEVFTDNSISQEITVSAWVRNTHLDELPDSGAFMWEFRQWDGISVEGGDRVVAVEVQLRGDNYIFHDSSGQVIYEHDWDTHTGWEHYAFVRDANNLKLYVNGQLEGVADSNGNSMAVPGLLYLGIAADRAPASTEGMHDGFTGNMDDFKIFNYPLSAAQVGYLAGDGDSIFEMDSWVNFYDEELPGSRAVNFRDEAVLADDWGEQILWP